MFRWFSGLRVVLRSVFRRRHVDEELDREMQYHLDRQIDEGVKAGLSPEEARYAALQARSAKAKKSVAMHVASASSIMRAAICVTACA